MGDKFWYLKNCNLFERLSEESIARLESRSKYRKFARKSLIYLPSDHSDSVLLLATGRVKMYHVTSDGKQTLLAIIDPGELFAANALLVGDAVVFPTAFDLTRQRLRARGIRVRCVDVTELAKAEGGVTCCSRVFSTRIIHEGSS